MLETEQYYRILDLEPGASPEEIHQGYLDLTWVWHPDRFAGHPRLQQKAHNKLQELNEAHERLRSVRTAIQTQNLRTKSKPQASPSQPKQSSVENLYKPQVSRDRGGGDQRTIKDSRSRVSFKGREIDAWLD
ncbi:MAG: J domain-containing protein [Coleofasciculus sp. S288]|nr:J domain-containing protein [Coleofasciculus sp. S288]